MNYFDYTEAAKQAGIETHDLQRIVESVRREFPRDDMLFELHVLRACMAIKDGWATLEQVLAEEPISLS
ncbi:MAG: hypothetical protein IT449_03385 [Phycisphaerales bacterium]|nr:hypothetical protein [Phycisphaerales bacterium]